MEQATLRSALARGSAAVLWVTLAASSTVTAHAQPLVRVQAGTQVTVQGTFGDGGLSIAGALLDDLGTPLAARTLAVEVEDPASDVPRHVAVKSGDDGSFGTRLRLPARSYRVHVRFAGDAHHRGSQVEYVTDPERASVRIVFVEPRELRVNLDEPQQVLVRLGSARGGHELRVTLADERGTMLAHGTTDAHGLWRASLSPQALGAPGRGTWVVTSEADATRAAARAELAILRFRATRLSLRASVDPDAVTVTGELRDSQGGVSAKAVSLYESGEHVATLLTDASGRFARSDPTLRARAARGESLALQARFESDAAWLGSSRSPTVALAIAPESPPSPWWLLVPLSACALGLGLLFRRADASADASRNTPRSEIGIHPGQGRSRGRAECYEVEGTVRDAASGRPVRAAVALIGRDGTRIDLATRDDGRFRSPALAGGDWTLAIAAAGYSPLRRDFAIPHHGEWSDVRVQLQSLRTAAVLAYKPAALRMLASADAWLRFTPRETLAQAVRTGRATEAFAELTDRVERAAYARTPPSAEDVAAVEKAARAALARFPNGSSQSGASELLRATFPHRR